MTDKTPRITVVGGGNVATHLITWLNKCGICATQANPHTLCGIDAASDICLVAVCDDVIAEVAAKADLCLTNPNALIAHTSGTTPLSALNTTTHRKGVFYPMQTFTKGRKMVYAEIPIFVEADTDYCTRQLLNLGQRMSSTVQAVDSETRAHIHLGAVYACNFLNYMLTLAEKSVAPCGISLDIYAPLIKATIEKALECGPSNAQTGPGRRGDLSTMWAHMDLLRNHPHMSRVYRLLSQQILNLYK